MTREPLRFLLDPGLRFLRGGRGNRRVRKVRILRGLARRWRVIVTDVLPTLLLLFGAARGLRHLAAGTSCAVASIEVEGASRTTPDAVRAQLAGFTGRNLLRLDLDEVAERARRDAWVLDASVKRVLPHTLRVVVAERTPAALALVAGLVQVVDDTGTPIGPVGPELAEDLPVLTGADTLRGEAGRAALQRGVRALARLRKATPDWVDELSELDLSRADAIRAVTRTPGPALLLDPEEAERNVETYRALRREIEESVGSVKNVDLRWRDRISVLPAEEEGMRGSN